MINLKNRTEFSFRFSYGKIKDIISNSKSDYCSITDRFNTFGHVPFWNECRKQGKRPILGVELAFVENASLKVRQTVYYVTLVALNQKGLSLIYQLVSKSTKQKYYLNRLSFEELRKIPQKDVLIIVQDSILQDFLQGRLNSYYGLSPLSTHGDYHKNNLPIIAISENLYDKPENKELYEIILGNNSYDDRVQLSHILSEEEWKQELFWLSEEEKDKAIKATYDVVSNVEFFDFVKADLPMHTDQKNLFELCQAGAIKRKINLNDPIYKARLEREMALIEEKNYINYFYIVYDLVKFAKQHMLVGCARGSSAGSLVCFLLGITDIDPLKFNLIFERFIDVNRYDLPDIDIDFQDTKREMLLDYLKEKYGADCVAKLGTVSKYKPKSILTELAKVLNIPQWEIKDLKDAIIERSGGDSRASNCLEDTFREFDIGRDFLKQYPKLTYSQAIEGHSRHYGQHAAAIVVADKPLDNYCSLDYSVDGCQLDKIDAEFVNLLKIDCLGLRTLSVIQDCLDLIGKDRDWLVEYPIDDKKAFDVINSRKYSGIFQFEGSVLKSLSKQMEIKNFEDISAITALARPGPLISGGTDEYISARSSESVNYLPLCEKYTKETFGIIIYQEQVIQISKEIGMLSWEETTALRKTMSKSMGKEFFDKYYEKFKEGAMKEHGISQEESLNIWNKINTMGAWAFNKSHSIAYGMISYWCMVLKAHWPLEFAIATLKNAKDSDQAIQILKELVIEGYEYKPFDAELSDVDWSIKDGKLIGGFINIKGIGKKKAEKMVEKIKQGKEFTVAEKKALFNAETPFDCLFEFKEKFTPFYKNWEFFTKTKPFFLKDISGNGEEVRFIAKTVIVNPRDINENILVNKRDGKVVSGGCLKFLDMTMSDDTEIIKCRIPREIFEEFGKPILNKDKVGDYYLVHGKTIDGFRFIMIKNIKKITPEMVNEKLSKKSC